MSDYPTIRPRLLLDFANSKKLDRRVTFRRSSTGTYVGADGLIKTANIDEPRFDHDPVTGVCKGLLVEESRQNLLTYSEQFDNAAWTKVNASISANFVTAPDGSMSGDKLVESVGTVQPVAFVSVSVTSGSSYSFSVYCKAAERSTIQFYFTAGNPTGSPYINFDLYNNRITVGGTGATGLITSAGNGWYRCSATYTATSTATQTIIILLTNTFSAARASSYTGNGISGVYLWGAQLEAGAFPTSYIPTTASTVTRSADSANITGTNFSSWYNQSEGTLVHVGNFIGDVFTLTYARLNSLIVRFGNSNLNSFTNQWTIGGNRSSGPSLPPALDSIVYNGSNVQNLISYYELFNVPVGSKMKISSYIDTVRGSVGHCLNGLPVERISIVNTPPWNNLSLTTAYDGSVRCGTISSFAYWPKRLPDAQLRALTRR